MHQTGHYYVFLSAGEVTGGVAGHLSEVDGFTSKIDKGVAALFREVVTDNSDSTGSTGASFHWVDKQLSVGWRVRSWSRVQGE